jgi:Tat protein translocase TatB subunit
MILLVVLALVVFGPEGLPEMVRTATRTIKAFKQASHDFQSEFHKTLTFESQKREVEARRRKRTERARQRLEETSGGENSSEQAPAVTVQRESTEAVHERGEMMT